MTEKLKRQLMISPAFDKRNDNPQKDFGICGCRIFFAVVGKKGAVTVNFSTNWYLESTVNEYKNRGINRNLLGGGKEQHKTKIDLEVGKPISSGSWDYHCKRRRYKGQMPFKNCEFIGGDCYGDGSCLRADVYLRLLIERGSDAVFTKLEIDYYTEFEHGGKPSGKQKR